MALGLPPSGLQDIKTQLLLHGSGSDVFFNTAMLRWISYYGTDASFVKLVEILNRDNFKAVAESTTHQITSGNFILKPGITTSNSTWFDVPQRIVLFTGRVQELVNLHEAIIQQNTEATVITTLSGLGGIGKTTLSIQYAWTYYKNFFTNIIWLNSETNDTLADSIKRLAEELRIDMFDSKNSELTPERLILRVYDKFHSGNTLVIFDNVDCYEDIKAFMSTPSPNKTKPFVLFTSRNRNWNDRVKIVSLDVFSEGESIDFLSKYLHLETRYQRALAKEKSVLVQNLPLGIRQAGAYIKHQNEIIGGSIEVQLEKYRNNSDENFKTVAKHKYWNQTDDPYEKTVYVTWNVTMDKIQKMNKFSIRIMRLISYLNPDNIPVQLFYYLVKTDTSCCDYSNEADIIVGEAIKLLHSYSLINRNDGANTFNIHRLLQKVIKIQVEAKFSFSILKSAQKLIEIPLGRVNYGQFEESCLIHAQSVLANLQSNFPKHKSLHLQKIVSERQHNVISHQLKMLIHIYGTKGIDDAIIDFVEFDKSFHSNIEYKLYVDKYFGGFVQFLFDEIKTNCESREINYNVILELGKKANPIYKKYIESGELNSHRNYLHSFIPRVMKCVNYCTVSTIKSELLDIVLNIFKIIIEYRKIHCIKPFFNGPYHFGGLFECLESLGRGNELLELVRNLNQILSQILCSPVYRVSVDCDLGDSILSVKAKLNCKTVENELIQLAVFAYNNVYLSCNVGTESYRLFESALRILKCLGLQGKNNIEILEFVSKFNKDCLGMKNNILGMSSVRLTSVFLRYSIREMVRRILGPQSFLRELTMSDIREVRERAILRLIPKVIALADRIFQIAINANRENTRVCLLQELLTLLKISSKKFNMSVTRTSIGIRIVKCLVHLDRFREFRQLITKFGIVMIQCTDISNSDKFTHYQTSTNKTEISLLPNRITFNILKSGLTTKELILRELIAL